MADETFNGKIHIQLASGSGLVGMDSGGTVSDPYVVVSVGEKRWKSRVEKATLEPAWDQSGSVGPFKGGEAVVVEVIDWDRFGSNDAMGTVSIPIADIPAGGEDVEPEVRGYEIALEDGTAAGEIQLGLTFEVTVVPPDEIPVHLEPLQNGQDLEERSESDMGKIFHGKFLIAMIQRCMRSVNLPFLNNDEEKKLYRMLFSRISDFLPMNILKMVMDLPGVRTLTDLAANSTDLVKDIFSEGFKKKIVDSFTGVFDIPFLGEESERHLFANAFTGCKSLLRQDIALFTYFLAGLRHLYDFRGGDEAAAALEEEEAAAALEEEEAAAADA